MVSSTFSVERVIGCRWTARSSFGNWWTYLWIVFPIFGIRMSSPDKWNMWLLITVQAERGMEKHVVGEKTHQSHCGWGHRGAQTGSFSSQSSWLPPLAASWTVAVETSTATCREDTECHLPILANKAQYSHLLVGKYYRLTFSCQSSCKDSWSCLSAEPSPCSVQSQIWPALTFRHSERRN